MFSFSAAGGQQTTAKRHQPHGNSFLLRVLQDNDSPTITTATGGTRSSSRSRSRSWSRPQASKHGHLGAIVNCCCQLREQNMHTATEWMKAARLGSPPPPLLLQLLTTTGAKNLYPKSSCQLPGDRPEPAKQMQKRPQNKGKPFAGAGGTFRLAMRAVRLYLQTR